MSGTSLHDPAPWAPGTSVGLSLLTPTVLYVRDVMAMLGSGADVRGLVHMTGGGFPENIPRVVPKGLAARVRRDAWQVPALFQWLQQVRAGARARCCCCRGVGTLPCWRRAGAAAAHLPRMQPCLTFAATPARARSSAPAGGRRAGRRDVPHLQHGGGHGHRGAPRRRRQGARLGRVAARWAGG